MVDIRDYETRTRTTYKLDIGGFVDELVREKLDEAFRKKTGKEEIDIDYCNITRNIIYSYLIFRCIHPKGSVDEFVHNDTYMNDIIKCMDNHVRHK